MSVSAEAPPEAKKLRMDNDFPSQAEDTVYVEKEGYQMQLQVVPSKLDISSCSPFNPQAPEASPAPPSSARSSNGSASSTSNDEDPSMHPTNLIDFISKNILGSVFKMDQLPLLLSSSECAGVVPSMPVTPAPPPIPGALAVSQMPTAQLFADDDWSWHRNPAASIRSGGTNKQTPVWKYFVYDKTDNLSRCIVGDCTYQLKGPHTSTLACHLKKHPVQYSEFQRLKCDYSRERTGSNLPPSPASSSSGGSTTSPNINVPSITPQPQHIHINNNNNIVKKEQRPKAVISTLQHALSSRPTPSTPPPLNPFPFLFPTSNASLANTVLQQHGMAIGPQGQLVLTKKWRREERKQREMEHRVSLFVSCARLPSSIVFDHSFRDLLDNAQPKFQCPDDAMQVEQLMAAQYGRLHMALRQQLHSVTRLSLLVDLIPVPAPPLSHRMAVTASVMNPLHSLELILLAVRPIEADSGAEGVKMALEEVMAEYGISMDKVTRIVTSGFSDLDEKERVFGKKQMESYKLPLLSALSSVIDASDEVDRVKKAFYSMIVSLVTHEGLFQAFTKAIGHPINIPITESFFSLLETILSVKGALVSVLSSAAMDTLSPDQWRLCECLSSLFSRLTTKSTESVTIDTVVPSLLQMIVTIEKDACVLGALAGELKEELRRSCSCILDPCSPSFDGSFLQATALNPQLVLLLHDDQVAAAKNSLEKAVHDKIRAQDEAANKKRSSLSLDSILATVIDRRGGGEGEMPPTSLLYPDLLHAAQQKKKSMEGGSRPSNGFAEALVHTYFDEACQCDSLAGSFSFSNRHLPAPSFWHANAHRCPQLAEIALDLLSVPASTPGREVIFAAKGSPFDPVSLLVLPDRLERDTVLRFNHNLLPKTF